MAAGTLCCRPHPARGRSRPCPSCPNRSLRAALAARERETLELIAQGLSNREIGATLVVEESSIRTHVKRVPMRLGLRDLVQAVILAYGNGINRPRR